MEQKFDVVIIGAGAAGMMCAIEAGKRGRNVILLDHAKKIGEKIRISGGGRCNFTNIYSHPKKFISLNPSFIISALNQYTHQNFIDLMNKHRIKFHEKKLGQLFCDESAQQIIDMLLLECQTANVFVKKETIITDIDVNTDDTCIIQIPEQKILDVIKFEKNSQVIVTRGVNAGRIGLINEIKEGTFTLPKRINLLIDDKTIEIPANITMAVGKEKSVIQIR